MNLADVYLRPVPANGIGADPWLYDPTLPDVTTSLPRDDKPRRRTRRQVPVPERGKIVATSLLSDLVKRYGITDGHRIYWEMAEQRKGPFQPGKKYGPPLRRRRRRN